MHASNFEQSKRVRADGFAHVVTQHAFRRGTDEYEAPVARHHRHHVRLVDSERSEIWAFDEGQTRLTLHLALIPRPCPQAEDGVDHRTVLAIVVAVAIVTVVALTVVAVVILSQLRYGLGWSQRRSVHAIDTSVGGAPPLAPHATGAVDPTHAAASPAGRSASHRGWKTCHWSGARRISPSRRVAISCVRRATSARSDFDRVVSSGCSTMAR